MVNPHLIKQQKAAKGYLRLNVNHILLRPVYFPFSHRLQINRHDLLRSHAACQLNGNVVIIAAVDEMLPLDFLHGKCRKAGGRGNDVIQRRIPAHIPAIDRLRLLFRDIHTHAGILDIRREKALRIKVMLQLVHKGGDIRSPVFHIAFQQCLILSLL